MSPLMKSRAPRLAASGSVKQHRQGLDDRRLALAGRLQFAGDLQPLELGLEIGVAQLLLGAAGFLDLDAHVVEVDEHPTLDFRISGSTGLNT
jgi:hypothetical protein